jgi:hypothetical protein
MAENLGIQLPRKCKVACTNGCKRRLSVKNVELALTDQFLPFVLPDEHFSLTLALLAVSAQENDSQKKEICIAVTLRCPRWKAARMLLAELSFVVRKISQVHLTIVLPVGFLLRITRLSVTYCW